jgi:hypothetical protein
MLEAYVGAVEVDEELFWSGRGQGGGGGGGGGGVGVGRGCGRGGDLDAVVAEVAGAGLFFSMSSYLLY